MNRCCFFVIGDHFFPPRGEKRDTGLLSGMSSGANMLYGRFPHRFGCVYGLWGYFGRGSKGNVRIVNINVTWRTHGPVYYNEGNVEMFFFFV